MGLSQKERSQRVREKKRKLRLCLDCPNPAPDHARCQECRDRRARYKFQIYKSKGPRRKPYQNEKGKFTSGLDYRSRVESKVQPKHGPRPWWADPTSKKYKERYLR